MNKDNTKINLLLSIKIPEGKNVIQACDLENNIKKDIQNMLAEKYPELRWVLADDEMINERLVD